MATWFYVRTMWKLSSKSKIDFPTTNGESLLVWNITSFSAPVACKPSWKLSLSLWAGFSGENICLSHETEFSRLWISIFLHFAIIYFLLLAITITANLSSIQTLPRICFNSEALAWKAKRGKIMHSRLMQFNLELWNVFALKIFMKISPTGCCEPES